MQLAQQQCVHNEEARSPLDEDKLQQLMNEQLSHCQFDKDTGAIYYHTMAFVNAVAWIANKQAHHPDLEVSYGHCLVRYTTHDAGNSVCMNDLICAAHIDALENSGTFGPNFLDD